MNDHQGRPIAIVNTRTRFQRTSDARFFHGRVRSYKTSVLVVSCFGELPFKESDRFAFQVYCNKTDAFFFATYSGRSIVSSVEEGLYDGEVITESDFAFIVDSEVKFIDAQQEARYCPRFVTADITWEAYKSPGAKVLDVSDCGLSLSCLEEFRKGTIVSLDILAYSKIIPATAEVRYCVRDRNRPGYNRIGLKLKEMDRVDEKRWRQMINHLIDQSRTQDGVIVTPNNDDDDRMRPLIAV